MAPSALLGLLSVIAIAPAVVHAQAQGFAVNRLQPSAPGEWFFAVDHPWYSSTRWFAGGVSLSYAHRALTTALPDGNGVLVDRAAVDHLLLAHVDLAGSFLDRVRLTLSLPITLQISGPLVERLGAGPAVGDVRIGAGVRVYQSVERDPFSLSLALEAFAPVGGEKNLAGDSQARVLPKVIAGGTIKQLRWAVSAGFLVRGPSTLDSVLTGNEVQLALGVAWANRARTLHVGPEILFASTVEGNSRAAICDGM